jgi:6-pyruvoyl-tetrahydropterin synthase
MGIAMYAVEVRDHIMIAHSLPGEVFGPAQRLHGATFVVDVAFFRPELGPDGIVVDIGRASEVLRAVLAPLNYGNLDSMPAFAGQKTTTEFLSRYIFEQIAQALRDGKLGRDTTTIDRIRVTLHESHIARGWYEAPIGP